MLISTEINLILINQQINWWNQLTIMDYNKRMFPTFFVWKVINLIWWFIIQNKIQLIISIYIDFKQLTITKYYNLCEGYHFARQTWNNINYWHFCLKFRNAPLSTCNSCKGHSCHNIKADLMSEINTFFYFYISK